MNEHSKQSQGNSTHRNTSQSTAPHTRGPDRMQTGIAGPRRHPRRRPSQRASLSGRGRSRHRKNHPRPAVPARRNSPGRECHLRHPLRIPSRVGTGRPLARLVGRQASDLRDGAAAGRPQRRSSVHRLPSFRSRIGRHHHRHPRAGRPDQARSASSSIPSPNSACSRAIHSNTAARSLPSNVTSPAATAPSCCSTTAPPKAVHDLQLQSIAHGVVMMQSLERDFGIKRRRVEVRKLRGSPFREGFHDYTIETGGISIYPRLIAAEHKPGFVRRSVPSGLAELDDLFGGGIDTGTSTLFIGPAGCGKSTVALRYAVRSAQARRESRHLHLRRSLRHPHRTRPRTRNGLPSPFSTTAHWRSSRSTPRNSPRENLSPGSAGWSRTNTCACSSWTA